MRSRSKYSHHHRLCEAHFHNLPTLRAHALLDGLKGLFGIDDFRVGCDGSFFVCFIIIVLIMNAPYSETGRIQIFVTFGDLRACLSLDTKNHNKLLDLQVQHALWIFITMYIMTPHVCVRF